MSRLLDKKDEHIIEDSTREIFKVNKRIIVVLAIILAIGLGGGAIALAKNNQINFPEDLNIK